MVSVLSRRGGASATAGFKASLLQDKKLFVQAGGNLASPGELVNADFAGAGDVSILVL
jgi:hypothetical protein